MVEHAQHRLHDGLVFGEATCANHAAGQVAAVGRYDADVAAGQGFEIRLGRRMLPHVHVHRRSHDDGGGSRQIHRGEEIVRDAVGEFCNDVGGRGRDDERVGGLGSVDVLDGRSRISRIRSFRRPETGNDFVSGESGKGEWLDEVLGRLGHHDVDVERLLLQVAHQFRRFVRRDAARNADRDLHEDSLRCGFTTENTESAEDSRGERAKSTANEPRIG